MEQKCTLEKLIKILNKIIKAMGYGHIAKIGMTKGRHYIVYFDDQEQPSKNTQL